MSATANESAAPLRVGRKGVRPLSSLLLYGSATLGLAVGLERVLGFIANVLAARIAGPQTFGAYSMVLATASAIAVYAGAGIGTTATRFSGQYRPDTAGYRRFIVALAVIAVASASVAALLMLAGAGPLARWVLKNEGLISFLRFSAASSAAIVLLDCCRGLLLGQQKYQALLGLSAVSGIGLILVLALAARVSAGMMILGQGSVALLCVALFVVMAKRFALGPAGGHDPNAGPGIRSVFTFGLVQFSAFAGISIASWWMASLVVRSDATLTQMGLYAIANQFRGLVALAPGLCAQVGYSLLTDESGARYGGANRVLLVNSFLASSLTTLAATVGILVAPWLLGLVYGKTFSGAEAAIVIFLGTAVIHMSGVPATQRLNIVGLRLSGIITTIWALLTAGLGIWLVPANGATGAAVAFLISHTLAQMLIILALRKLGELPKGYLSLFGVTTIGSVLLAALGYWRALEPNRGALTMALAGVALLMWSALWYTGRRIGCLPEWRSIRLSFNQNEPRDLARS
ncbi:MAG TPA: oligosaccharide flippase family protein [Pyrinomonadaceae bacterium]|nr:oligosaccharide flippase family protein [Pyrinomonadaceae bacterium]